MSRTVMRRSSSLSNGSSPILQRGAVLSLTRAHSRVTCTPYDPDDTDMTTKTHCRGPVSTRPRLAYNSSQYATESIKQVHVLLPTQLSSRTFIEMGPPAAPSAGVPQHGRGNGGYTIYGSAHQAHQGAPPTTHHHYHQTLPTHSAPAQAGKPVAGRRSQPGH